MGSLLLWCIVGLSAIAGILEVFSESDGFLRFKNSVLQIITRLALIIALILVPVVSIFFNEFSILSESSSLLVVLGFLLVVIVLWFSNLVAYLIGDFIRKIRKS